ncbi:DUF11 domain-containing protein [bacterium]|nr:DUF11 domain-containing protein [bacterium]
MTVEPDLSVSLNKKMKSATRDGSKWTVIWTITGTSKNQTSDTIALVDTLPEGYSYVRNNANYNYNNGTFTVPANKDFNFEITTTTSSLKDEKENKICFEKICDTEKTPKIAIEKTPETTDISKMGQEVKWKITVKTLNAQPITNFQITDTLPEGLAFKSITSDKFSASQISTKEENKSLIVSVNGTLNGNSTATFTLTTTVTKAEASYKNTACLEGSELCDDGEITTKFAPKLNIQKYFVLDANGSNQSKKHTAVKKDETVYYKIEFKNEGEKDATVKVEDIFPANLTNTGIDTFVLDGETKDKSELSSFTLKEKGNGYIITHGTTTSENRSSTTNTGRITKLDDNGNTPSNCQKNDCYFEDTVTYTVDMHPKLWIEKGILKEGNFYTGMQTSLEYKGGDEIEFRVNFGNSGDIEIENLRFEDVLENLEFLDRKVTYEEHLYIDGTEINKSDPFTLED